MTKLEKFEEVFGFEPDVDNSNILPSGKQCPYYNDNDKMGCRCDSNALDWWYSDYKEPRKGKWVHKEDMDYLDKNDVTHNHFMCNKCGFIHDFIDGHTAQYNYCPNCGADMKEVKE